MSPTDQRYAFVCGLHRSGTTLIARSLAAHAKVSGFTRTGVIEDEGQFLQTVFPLESFYGGVGRFGFDPRAHMTESHALNTAENSMRLLSEWGRYWDLNKPVLLEKTPSNLLRMRLLQALVPNSHFIVVTRHPVAASLAALKWTKGNIFSLLAHWAHCYQMAKRDEETLSRVLWVSYESFVAHPEQELARITEFLNLQPQAAWAPQVTNENEKYFGLWRTRFCGDMDRAIEQLAPERPRSLATRLRDRVARDSHERELPIYRQRDNRRSFYDAQDAATHFEAAINAFGYSFLDLARVPSDTQALITAP